MNVSYFIIWLQTMTESTWKIF